MPRITDPFSILVGTQASSNESFSVSWRLSDEPLVKEKKKVKFEPSNLFDTSVADVHGLSLRKGDLYGVENEAETNSPVLSFDSGCFSCIGDGSLRGFGIEFVSEAATIPSIIADWRKVKSHLEASGIRFLPSSRTSTHVHANVSDLNYRQMLTFLFLLWVCEEALFTHCDKSRRGNLFCLPVLHTKAFLLETTKYVKNSIRLVPNHEYRYAATNMCSINKHGTLEVRMKEGTYDPDRLEEWVLYIDQIKKLSLTFNSPQDIMDLYFRDPGQIFDRVFRDVDSVRNSAEPNEVLLAKFADSVDWSAPDWRTQNPEWAHYIKKQAPADYWKISAQTAEKWFKQKKPGGLTTDNPFRISRPLRSRDLTPPTHYYTPRRIHTLDSSVDTTYSAYLVSDAVDYEW